jgi:hypothetical protein
VRITGFRQLFLGIFLIYINFKGGFMKRSQFLILAAFGFIACDNGTNVNEDRDGNRD